MARRRNKGEEKSVALERMHRLMQLAVRRRDALADRYVRLARRLGMRYQVSMPGADRRRVCRACESLLVPGRTARVRVAHGRVTTTCLRCTAVRRVPFRPTREVAT